MSRLREDGGVLKLLFAKQFKRKSIIASATLSSDDNGTKKTKRKAFASVACANCMLKMFTTSLPNNCIHLTNAQ